MSDLSHKVVDRYKVERLTRAIVTSRWLFAKKMLAPGLKAVLPELQVGELKPVMKALDDLWMVFEIHEAPGELGSVFTINAEWWYGLGPRIRDRIKKLILDIKKLRRQLTWLEGQGKPGGKEEQIFFQRIIRESSWLEGVIPVAEGIPHGDFTVIPVKGVSQKDITSCLAALDKAAAYIRPKFPQVLYGKAYLGTSVGRGYSSVALYSPGHDTLALSTRTALTVGDVHAICHELGHRYYTKFWKNKEQRDAFWHLSVDSQYETVDFDKATRGKMADEFIFNSEKMREGGRPPTSDLLGTWIVELKRRPEIREVISLGKKFTWEKDDSVREKLWLALALPSESGVITVRTDKEIRGPLAVTPYGGKDWKENFAEAFAFYVMGKPLPPEISAIFDRLG